MTTTNDATTTATTTTNKEPFDLDTALFCGGLAFDSYVEPPANSSRWEKGPQGLKVAFVSPAYTRQLYKGIVEIVVNRATGLPDDENGMERMVSGKGVDAAVLAAAVEGSWTEDVRILEKEIYHEGVLDLTGSAHVVRTSVAWANIDEKQSQAAKKRRGWAAPYHIPSSWGKGGQAVWPEDNPLFIYVQDPATVRLVFTVMDENKMGQGTPVGSTYRKLSELIPEAAWTEEELVESLKAELLQAVQRGEVDLMQQNLKMEMGPQPWQGDLRLSSKPRKKDKNSQVRATCFITGILITYRQNANRCHGTAVYNPPPSSLFLVFSKQPNHSAMSVCGLLFLCLLGSGRGRRRGLSGRADRSCGRSLARQLL